MKLYQMQDSGNCYKVRMALAHTKRSAELCDIDILVGESRTPEFLALNPNGRVPLLETRGGECLAESNAILWYLCAGTPLVPDDALTCARVLQWMFFEQYSHEPYIATVRYWRHIAHAEAEHAAQIAERVPGGYAALAVMEGHLADRRFFAGDFSIADLALYAYTHVAGEGGFDLASYPGVRRWLADVASRPGHVPMEARSWPTA